MAYQPPFSLNHRMTRLVASQVHRLMTDLLTWIEQEEAHPLIASAAFHYEFEFIHPFSDGNGRLRRLWQTLILSRWQPILAYLPVETVIKHHQSAYYRLLSEADALADCSEFIVFMLESIEGSLHEAVATQSENTNLRVESGVETKVKTPEQVLKLLRAQPELSLAEVAHALGRSVSTVERTVNKLKQQNRLSYHGPKKNGHWQVH